MITIERTTDNAPVIIVVEGKCTAGDLVAVVEKEYESISSSVLWDFSKCDLSSISPQDGMSIIRAVSKHARHKKTAYVGNADFSYGLLRMYENHSMFEDNIPETHVFRTRREALAWLIAEG